MAFPFANDLHMADFPYLLVCLDGLVHFFFFGKFAGKT